MDYLVWTLVGLMILSGWLGSLIPVLPGTTIILVGVLIQKWVLPDTLSRATVGWVVGIWLFSVLADFVCTLLGTRLFGGSKWGMAGATGGALAGMFISLPAILLGSVLGAAASEKWLAKRSGRESWRSGAGAAVGFVVSAIVKFGCATVMTALYAVAVWHYLPKWS